MSSRPVLVGYDGSPHADAAVDHAARLLDDAELLVACVWTPVASATALLAVPAHVATEAGGELDHRAATHASQQAKRGCERAESHGRRASTLTLRGHRGVWPALLDAARERDAAAIVLGSRGHSTVASALLGSTSDSLLHHADRPVLVVPGPDDD